MVSWPDVLYISSKAQYKAICNVIQDGFFYRFFRKKVGHHPKKLEK